MKKNGGGRLKVDNSSSLVEGNNNSLGNSPSSLPLRQIIIT